MRTIDWCVVRCVVRKGEGPALHAPPELADAISAHVHNPDTNHTCPFCWPKGHGFGGVMVLRKNKIPGLAFTICTACAKHDDEKLIDMAQEQLVWQWTGNSSKPIGFG